MLFAMQHALFFALILMGFTFTVTQVMVIRELLVIFLGNELSLAIILSDWLLLEAAGSFFLGRRLERAASRKGYAFLQLLLSLLLPVTIFGIRCLRDIMGLSIGEGASLPEILFWTALLLTPLGIVDGVLFASGCSLHAGFSGQATLSIGKVYCCEGLGAGLGGIIFTLLFIPLFNSFEVALLLGMANLLSGLLLLAGEEEKGWQSETLAGFLWLFLAAGPLLFILPGSETYLSPEVSDMNLCLRQTLERVFPSVYILPGEENLFLAFSSPGIGPPSPEGLIERLHERRIGTHFVREPQIRLKLTEYRLKWLEDSLNRGGAVKLNLDAHPAGLYYAIAYWNARFHPLLQVFWASWPASACGTSLCPSSS